MTQITRNIEIDAPVEKVWSKIEPTNWTKTFDFVKEVDGETDGGPGVGTHVKVEAGEAESRVMYNIEITEFKENEKIVYRRFGGPLSGQGRIQLKSRLNSTLLSRTSYYEDNLTAETIRQLSAGIEHDNRRLKQMIETRT